MPHSKPNLAKVVPECLPFAVRVVELFEQRWQEDAQQPLPARLRAAYAEYHRKWTFDELRTYYPSWGSLLSGEIRYPPKAAIIKEIAAYLACTLDERNSLLLAARYAPEQLYPTGEELKRIIQLGEDLLRRSLPYAGYIATPDWRVPSFNEYLLTLFEATPEELERIFAKYDRNKVTVLHLLFDRDLPVYQRLSQDREQWDRIRVANVYRFMLLNLLSRYDQWFLDLIEDLCRLPEFAEAWQIVARTPLPPLDSPLYTLVVTTPSGRIMRVRPLQILISNYTSPTVIVYVPDEDAGTCAGFNDLGLPSRDNGWGAGVEPKIIRLWTT